MNKESVLFRKAAFGGFNRRDVIDYIERMRNESYEYKKQVEETVKSLNEKIRELENAARLIESPAPCCDEVICDEPSEEGLCEIGEATQHLKSVADELCRSLGDFMDKLNEKGLFEKASDGFGEAEEIPKKEEMSFVDGVLASISYFEEPCAVKEKPDEKKPRLISVDELLSDFGFIK